MKRIHIVLALFVSVALAGCESKEAKLAALKAQYQPMYKQYFNDCLAIKPAGADSYFKGTPPPPPNPQREAAHNQKCLEEAKPLNALDQQMQALQK